MLKKKLKIPKTTKEQRVQLNEGYHPVYELFKLIMSCIFILFFGCLLFYIIIKILL
jgi:hypothetical protein